MITVRYELVDPDEIDGVDIDVQEDRGSLLIKINNDLTPAEIVGALNKMSQAVLAGGHWFQEWKGDIISIDPPDGDGATSVPVQRPSLYDVN